MIKIIGLETGKTYAKGKTKADCFRELQKNYPYKFGKGINIISEEIYPEPLVVRK